MNFHKPRKIKGLQQKAHPSQNKYSKYFPVWRFFLQRFYLHILELLYYSNRVGIDINFDILDKNKIKDDINDLKTKITSFEKSIHYKWYQSNKDSQIIKTYIAEQFLTNSFIN